jgi:hypothetical protein
MNGKFLVELDECKGAFTLANFTRDFALSLHVFLNKNYLFSLLNVQVSAKSRAKLRQCKCTFNKISKDRDRVVQKSNLCFFINAGEQAWSSLRNCHRKPIRIDSKSIWFRLESIRDEIWKSRNITKNFNSISDCIYACFQKNRCYFDIIEM